MLYSKEGLIYFLAPGPWGARRIFNSVKADFPIVFFVLLFFKRKQQGRHTMNEVHDG